MYINDVLNAYYSHKPLKMRRMLSELIYLSARENNLSAEMIMAVILTESSFKDDAVSNKGAMGLMQLLPSTAASIAEDLKIQWRGDRTLYDSQHNIRLGVYYLRKMMEVFDDMNTALTAYNAGPGYVINQTQQGKPYSDVYAKKVNENYRMLRKVYFNNWYNNWRGFYFYGGLQARRFSFLILPRALYILSSFPSLEND